jgi:L-seryl-tRNA(Ser) seleniumtransferase
MHPPEFTAHAAAELRRLPSVDALLQSPVVAPLLDEFPRSELVGSIRTVLERRRAALLQRRPVALDLTSLAIDVRSELHRRAQPSLRRVINATGIVLHTGLGRAPLAPEAIEAIAEVAAGYCNLELNLDDGQRGDRHDHLRELLCELTGAEDALVVNNNAAATYLTLHTLAAGRGVVVSRGQLVEIGGSYRMPDIMAAASCRMIEVGTTNRTHLSDYEAALPHRPAVLLRVHTSNYRVQGFTHEVPLTELVGLAGRARADASGDDASGDLREPFVVDDLGSGLLDRAPAEAAKLRALLADEPTVRESVAAGVDVTLFSGDKLLGGPQAGIIVGRRTLLKRMRGSPLMRTFRPDKLTLAALEATLRLYRDPAALTRRLPVVRMLLADGETLQATADRLASALAGLPNLSVRVAADRSMAGGGSLPVTPFVTWTVRVSRADRPAEALLASLRGHEPPMIARLHDGELVIDCRTLLPDDEEPLVAALAQASRD